MKRQSAQTVRPQVQEVLDEFKWLDTIQKDEEINRFKATGLNQRIERCMICTLPLGSCEHTTDWKETKFASQFIDNTENEIEAALDVLGDTNNNNSFDVDDDVDIQHLCWELFDERPIDRVGETEKTIFSPVGRYWHTTTKVGNFLVVFGGLRIR
jgi:hypothetical protein